MGSPESNKKWNLKNPEYNKNWKLKNIERYNRVRKKYNQKNRIDILNKKKTWCDNKRFNGNRCFVLKRDKYRCVRCGMPNKIHIEKFKRDLCIHHKNQNKKCNNIKNLLSLCISCHRKEHSKLLKFCKFGHRFNKKNSYIRKDNGYRQCRLCSLRRSRLYYKRKNDCQGID